MIAGEPTRFDTDKHRMGKVMTWEAVKRKLRGLLGLTLIASHEVKLSDERVGSGRSVMLRLSARPIAA